MCPTAIHLLTGHGTSLRQLHQWRTHGRYGREGFPQWFLDEAKPVRDVSTCRHVRDADSETSSGHEDMKSSKKPGSPCRDNVSSRHSSNASWTKIWWKDDWKSTALCWPLNRLLLSVTGGTHWAGSLGREFTSSTRIAGEFARWLQGGCRAEFAIDG
jgi:hypothetical protein